MNLWVRTLRQLTVLAVALFFFSCEDEASTLGFKNPNRKFKVNYVDIPLESSIFLMDSLRTSNFYELPNQDTRVPSETNRLLVGHYTDNILGEVNASAITQFFTTSTAKTLLKETAEFDSVSIQLRFDFYTYGGSSNTPQTLRIHEVQRELKIDSLGYYFNKTNIPYNPTPLGSKTFSYDPTAFKKYIEDKVDTTITIKIPLDLDFGQRIFDSAMKYRSSQTAADSSFVRIREFVKEFNGIAIVAESADKVFGFSPASTASRITLHYHDAETDSLQLNLAFNGMVGLNQIDGDYSSTEFAGLNGYSQPITPDNSLRPVQSGAGLLTRLDFSTFYDFVDQDSNKTMVVNSAELHLGAPEATSVYDPINALSLRAIQNEGYLRRIRNMADSVSLGLYAGQLMGASGMFAPVAPDGRSIFTVSKTGDNAFYNGYLTLFAQQLFKKDEDKERFRYFALYPEVPQVGKSVNRIIFREENIKLRVFYTRPNVPTP